MTPAEAIWRDIERIRAEAPLIHNITNYVVMNLTANALLALGASPVMAHAAEEVEEMAGLSAALVINIGTLSRPWIESMFKAAAAARRKRIPVVLDPVGAGATRLRTETARRILEEATPSIIRGNASEIRALHSGRGPGLARGSSPAVLARGFKATGEWRAEGSSLDSAEQSTKGVDSRHTSDAALDAARALSGWFGCVVSISGPVDFIVDRESVVLVANGHPLMPCVTGLGCTASAITGAFAAVNPSAAAAAAHAMAVMGIAGEMAAEGARGPASFEMNFLDALHGLEEKDVRGRLRMETA